MASRHKSRSVTLRFPVRGLNRRHAIQDQPPDTTPDCMNVWPLDPTTGRERGGIRPGLTTWSSVSGTLYGWCPITWQVGTSASDIKQGIAVASSNGIYRADTSGFSLIYDDTGSPSSPSWPQTASVAALNDVLFYANSGEAQVYVKGNSTGTAYSGGTLLSETTAGTAPTNCGIAVGHMDRLWLMAQRSNPNIVYASAAGDFTNWEYTALNDGAAFASSGTSGQLHDRITGALSHDSNILLVSCTDSLYAYIGNPMSGQIRQLSAAVGALNNKCLCKDAEGNTWLMTRKGLYVLPPGVSTPQRVSEDVIPDEMIGLNPSADDVCIGYDNRWQGIHIFVNKGSGTDVSFFFDLRSKGYWPQSFSPMPSLAAPFPAIQTDDLSSLVVFQSTSAQQFDRDGAEDRNSYIYIGPIYLNDGRGEGILHSISAALALNSGGVDWTIHVGDSAEEALNAAAAFTGEAWTMSTAGDDRYWNYMQHPRVRGNVAYVKVTKELTYPNSVERWILEEIVAEIVEAGRRRVG